MVRADTPCQLREGVGRMSNSLPDEGKVLHAVAEGNEGHVNV